MQKEVIKKRKNKKAQIFIIAGLIGVIIIFSFVSYVSLKEEKKPTKYYDLSKNFKRESIEIIAKGKMEELKGNVVIEEYLDNLTNKYLKYVFTEDPNAEIIWIYGNQSKITIYNFANQNATIYSRGAPKEIIGGRRKISSDLNLGEIKTKISNELRDYENKEFKQSLFNPSNTIIVNIGDYNYTFNLEEKENFYIILKSKKENETIVVKE